MGQRGNSLPSLRVLIVWLATPYFMEVSVEFPGVKAFDEYATDVRGVMIAHLGRFAPRAVTPLNLVILSEEE